MINSLVLLTIGSIFVGGIMSDGFSDFVLFSYFSGSSRGNSIGSCDNISRLLHDFDSFRGSLDSQTYIDISTNNKSKEFVNYWLYGTATEINWFDNYCKIGWDYIKGASSVTPVANNPDIGSIEELAVIDNNKPNYLAFALGCLLIGCPIFANFDILMAVFTSIDQHLYNILCMFDFPGFMVEKLSIMPLVPGIELMVQHFWNFRTDPVVDRLVLVHLASYTLDFESFRLHYHSLSPGWSIPSQLELILVPGLDWPFNYDHFHGIIWPLVM